MNGWVFSGSMLFKLHDFGLLWPTFVEKVLEWVFHKKIRNNQEQN